ncbi:MAG: hypothetical protein AVDCRST_MAG89-4130, partial [uncultured Gemmatimonadetes bacterium]
WNGPVTRTPESSPCRSRYAARDACSASSPPSSSPSSSTSACAPAPA